MKLYYASRMGKVETLANNVTKDSIKITTGKEIANEPFLLLTYTDGNGIVPQVVVDFLTNNKDMIKAVVAFGSMARHADTYCFAGDIIANEYNVPCILKVDGAGTDSDINFIKNCLIS